MKRLTILFILALAFGQAQAKVYFVKQGGQGDGSSWASALGSLHQALQAAVYGDEIWVARGTYFTTSGTDRSLYFQIKDGVKLYGGFAGHELAIAERNVEANQTILSGEIGTPSPDDNAYTVVFTKNVSAATVVDGFIITGGTANVQAEGDVFTPESCGGGWYNIAQNGTSSPVIKNCKFIDNHAREGAGLYNIAENGSSEPTIEFCQFISNSAKLDGGAIFNGAKGTGAVATGQIKNVRFEYNTADYGGCIVNRAFAGQVNPMIHKCNFSNNRAKVRGAVVYNDFSNGGQSKAVMFNNITGSNNVSSVGEPVSSRSGVSAQQGY